ncbi:hypothetical protein [Pseudalkalibacillus sp. SCS-8]|uniref:hypothetical protein n=1 Tax=Pseudalkalibacillus nanhaiensis TaxID=3115291 RepID=UPI0032DB008B
MENERLIDLRRTQFLILNASVIVVFSAVIVAIALDVTLAEFTFVVAILTLIQSALYFVKGKSFSEVFSKKMNELMTYEKERMGAEWRKQRRTNAIMQLFLGAVFLSNSIFLYDDEMYADVANLFPYMFYFLLGLMVLINVTTFVHNRKVDRNKIKKGYTLRTFLLSLIVGLVIVSIVNFVVLTTILD